jgi:activator of HSP90 ATPase
MERMAIGKVTELKTRRQVIGALAFALGGTALARPATASPAGSEELSHSAEAIHQETVFKASKKRVYELLSQSKEFDKVVRLSAAMKSGMPPESKPTEISKVAGGTFTIFGGHILGRHIELMPNERMVQAWRVVDWKPGQYSIAKFELFEQGADTKLVFDHTGFPKGLAEHLAEGWTTNYWEPLAKVLASS